MVRDASAFFKLDLSKLNEQEALSKLYRVPANTVAIHIYGYTSLGLEAASHLADHLPALTSLAVPFALLGDENVAAIVKSLPSLIHLDMRYNSIGNEGAFAIAEGLPNLAYLELFEGSIGDLGAVAIAKGLPNLTWLGLAGNQIGVRGAFAIAEGLPNLINLDLEANEIGNLGAAPIAEGLPNLASLGLGGNQIGDSGAFAIAESLSNLISLSLRSNQISEHGVVAIANGLPNLTRLDLGYSGIGYRGAAVIAKGLLNLIRLDLSFSKIGDRGAVAIAKGLSSLTRLDLGCSGIGDRGAVAIAKGLSSLTRLDLGDNQIGEEGAVAIAKGLPNLTHLDLRKNRIGDEGTVAIAKGLPNLTSLDLYGNKIEGAPKDALSDIDELRAHFALEETSLLVPNTRVRAMLVGHPAAGKSTLAQFIFGQTVKKGDDSLTLGIERQSLKFNAIRHSKGQTLDYTLDLWDIGGQKLQHMCHRWFLRADSLYLLVIRFEEGRLQEDPDHPISYWLKLIARHTGAGLDGCRPTIIPIVNELVGSGSSSPRVLDEQLAPFRERFAIKDPFIMQVSETDGRLECHNTDSLKARIRDWLSEKGADEYLQVINELRGHLAPPATSVIPSSVAFGNLEKEGAFGEALNLIGSTEFKTTQDGLFTAVISHLERIGDIAVFGRGTGTGYNIVTNPDWINKGVYSLLPPEGKTLGTDTSHTFLKQLRQGTPPGVFSAEEVKVYWQDLAESDNANGFGVKSSEMELLLGVLSDRKMELIIHRIDNLSERSFFIPAYMEEWLPHVPGLLAARMRDNLLGAQACQIIEPPCDDWPSLFVYRLMVEFSHEPVGEGSYDRRRDGVKLQLVRGKEAKNAFKVADTTRDVWFDILFHDNRFYCFGHAGDRPGLLDAGFDVLEVTMDRLYADDHRARPERLERSLPCPKCLEKLAGHAGAHDSFFRALRQMQTWPYKQVLPSLRGDSGQQFDCVKGNHGHFSAKQILQPHLAAAKQAILEAETWEERSVERRNAAVAVSVYLVMFCGAQQTASKGPAIAYKGGSDQPKKGRPEVKTWRDHWLFATHKEQGIDDQMIKDWVCYLIKNFPVIWDFARMDRAQLEKKFDAPHHKVIVAAADNLRKSPEAFFGAETKKNVFAAKSKNHKVLAAAEEDQEYGLEAFHVSFVNYTAK